MLLTTATGELLTTTTGELLVTEGGTPPVDPDPPEPTYGYPATYTATYGG